MTSDRAGARSRVLVAIPAYNEEQTIEALVCRVRSAISEFDLEQMEDQIVTTLVGPNAPEPS